MKNVIIKAVFAISAICMFKPAMAEKKEWKELQAFHAVMSKSFHPTEEGSFQPLKDNAGQLLAKAQEWQKSAVPVGFNADETMKVLASLVVKCDEINKAVTSKASDAELKKLITEAHEEFHKIVAKCRKPESEK